MPFGSPYLETPRMEGVLPAEVQRRLLRASACGQQRLTLRPTTTGEAMRRQRSSARAVGVLLALTAVLLTTACGDQEQRSASSESEAPLMSSESDSAAPTSEPTEEPVGSGGNLGTRICIINESTRYRPFVTFSKKDSETGAGTVAYQEQACGEGTFASSTDVEGRISPDKALRTLNFYAKNPWIGKPSSAFAYADGPGFRYDRCVSQEGFDVNEERIWDDGVIRYAVKRLPDNNWKQFTITVTDSQDPAANGIQRDCPRSGGGAYPA